MKLSDLTSADEVKAEALRNPAVRAEWDRTAVARAVASRVVRYRVEHGLSQAGLVPSSGCRSRTLRGWRAVIGRPRWPRWRDSLSGSVWSSTST